MKEFREIICGGASNKELIIASGCVCAFVSFLWVCEWVANSLFGSL